MWIDAQRNGKETRLWIVFHSYVRRIDDGLAGDMLGPTAYVEINHETGLVQNLFAEHTMDPMTTIADQLEARNRGVAFTPRNPWRYYDLLNPELWRKRWADLDLLATTEQWNERAALFHEPDTAHFILAEDTELFLRDGREEMPQLL